MFLSVISGQSEGEEDRGSKRGDRGQLLSAGADLIRGMGRSSSAIFGGIDGHSCHAPSGRTLSFGRPCSWGVARMLCCLSPLGLEGPYAGGASGRWLAVAEGAASLRGRIHIRTTNSGREARLHSWSPFIRGPSTFPLLIRGLW